MLEIESCQIEVDVGGVAEALEDVSDGHRLEAASIKFHQKYKC